MEDEGTLADHLSGVSATDGQWHHVAVTWESSTGGQHSVEWDVCLCMWCADEGVYS